MWKNLPKDLQETWEERLAKLESAVMELPKPPEPVSLFDECEILKWQKMADAGVEPRSAAGQTFARSDMGKSAEYKQMNRADKAEARRKWAEGQWKALEAKRVASQSWKHVDANKGFYAPFAVIVREEGNDNAAVKAACHYVTTCERMGGVWKRFNKFTNRHEWLYMRKEVQETFEKAWHLYESAVRKGSSPEAPQAGGGGSVVVKGSKGKASGNGQDGQVDDVPSPSPAPKPKSKGGKTALDVAFGTANMSKKTFQSTMSKAGLVIDNISKRDEWMWARAAHKGRIEVLMNAITEVASSDFARQFLTMDPKDLKVMHKHSELQVNLETFSQAIDGPLDRLNKLIGKVMRMHHEAMQDKVSVQGAPAFCSCTAVCGLSAATRSPMLAGF
jgi:hypothetical protein